MRIQEGGNFTVPTQHRHIFLPDTGEKKNFTTPRSGGGQEAPPRNRKAHSAKLKEQWAAIWTKAREQEEARSAVSMPAKDGVYVEFEGAPGYELITKSLEDRRSGIRLLNVYTVQPENGKGQRITRATVFIPSGKQDHFLKKLNEYAEKDTPKGTPKNAKLLQSVEDIRIAVLESFWRDDTDLLPQGDDAIWCEIWLRAESAFAGQPAGDAGAIVEESFSETARILGVPLQERSLRFPERTVLLGLATRAQFAALMESSPYIAEFRRAKETARFFLELQNKEQAEWAEDLRSRLKVNKNPTVAVCVLDTGANNGHVLLEPILADGDCHAVDPQWGVNDHRGHGTLMCGIAAFGDLLAALQHDGPIAVEHCLESSKILPPREDNDPELYGDITIQGISRAEIKASTRSHIGCLAVTSEDGRDRGRPSSWSAAIDKLTSGYDDGGKRLFIMSAGNSERDVGWAHYPQSNLEYSVHDPGQSWNALTVGAYTEKSRLTDPDLHDHTPLAQPGQLSPFSSTSANWDSKWPVKPDIVLEGGNIAQAPDGTFSEHDDLSLLSTGHQPIRRQFDAINATSAAAAQAAWMAAQIQASYPDAWPETVRGLMIHSADWPDALKQQFLDADRRGGYSKSDYGKLLRICGYGVPNLSKAMACASNSLTLIAQSEMQPYTKKGSTCSTKDMHLHRIPWPRDILLSLGEMTVTLRITLSYFVEPGPGEVGWKDKYRYASHALRFDLNSMGEDEERFLRRLNYAAREEGEKPDSESGSDRWLIGSNNRSKGSVHSDIWRGTAADIATCNIIGVYPIGGWWRERAWLGRWDRKCRYSLIVSLHTSDEEIDIYTPVAQKVGITIGT
ncbi:MAG: S8 family peptidase [Candidatus Hydrogenedentes bacterium]|nr:S8 family peptidase [Candidatus Hydrogenedentota bacterium]